MHIQSPSPHSAYSPLGVFFVLRWQISHSQMKCNPYDHTYILYGVLIEIRNVRGSAL